MTGLSQGAFDYTIPYLKQRKQFGQSIAQFQGVQFQFAQEYMDIYASRLMVYEAARRKEAGIDFMREAAMAKLYSSQVAGRVTTKCIELSGGVGFTRDFIIEKFYRDSIVGKIYEGTSNICLNTIANSILKDYQ